MPITIDRRPGVYLQDHPPVRSQFRDRRADRGGIVPVIEVHTTEPPPAALRTATADGAASFIRGRAEGGSYHLVGDAHGRIVQLIDFAQASFHDRTNYANDRFISIALVMRAEEWKGVDDVVRLGNLLDVGAAMAAEANRWLADNGHGLVEARLLDRAQSDHPSASGFIGHGHRDTERRTDPGRNFPWDLFLERFVEAASSPAADPFADEVKAWQAAIVEAGYTTTDPAIYVDGKFGPNTLADSLRMLDDLNEMDGDPDLVRRAGLADDVVATFQKLADEANR